MPGVGSPVSIAVSCKTNSPSFASQWGGSRSEAARLRSIANASESRLKIEQTAQSQLASQVKVLEDENNRLKEDLAFFENLVPSERRGEKVSIHRFKVERDVLPGEFRYRLLVLQGGARPRVSRVFTARGGDAAGGQGCYNRDPRFSRDRQPFFQAQFQVFS